MGRENGIDFSIPKDQGIQYKKLGMDVAQYKLITATFLKQKLLEKKSKESCILEQLIFNSFTGLEEGRPM